jgi:DNA repair photolyase
MASESDMVRVTLVDRKSKALTPSRLRCLAHLPTINMTAGCVHGCAYCYIRGYSQYPGDDAVVVYPNLRLEPLRRHALPV